MDVIGRIIQNLAQEKEAYAQLVELSRQKQDCIMHDDIKGLSALLQKEQMLVKTIEMQEKQRDILTRELSLKSGIALKDLTLEAIAGLAQPEAAQALRQTKVEFSSILKEQMQLNETNQKLLETQLSFINFMLSTMTRQPDIGNNYGTQGQGRRELPTFMGLIDREV